MTEAELHEFLLWFKEETERAWASHIPRLSVGIKEEPEGRGAAMDWQTGTRWSPLTAAEIEQVERRWGLSFPWDDRLFLQVVGLPDRPALIERWIDDKRIACREKHYFMNWFGNDFEVAERLTWPEMGLLESDLHQPGLFVRPWWWDEDWGHLIPQSVIGKPCPQFGRPRR